MMSITNRIAMRGAAIGAVAVIGFAASPVAAAELLPCEGVEVDVTPLFTGGATAGDESFVTQALTAVTLSPGFLRLGGSTYIDGYVSVNGGMSFGAGLDAYTTDAFPGTDVPFLAPFFADIDLRDPSDEIDNPGRVLICEDFTGGTLTVTWESVVGADAVASGDVSLTNTFQLVIREEGFLCEDVPTSRYGWQFEFRYEEINWVAASRSGGVDGFCPEPLDLETCTPAIAGFDGGDDGTTLVIEGSLTNDIGAALLGGSNVGEAGVWRWLFTGDLAPPCGDGVTDSRCAEEECDDGGESSTCDIDCTLPECGDGILNTSAGEECEDGNFSPWDGCSPTCTLEVCGEETATIGSVTGSFCDAGDNDPTPFDCAIESNPEAEDRSYVFTAPGRGFFDFSTLTDLADSDPAYDQDTILYIRDECGDEDTLACNDDAFDSFFSAISEFSMSLGQSVIVYVTTWGYDQICGDYELTISGTWCGDGILDEEINGELCDDGNVANDDGCSADCYPEFCGDGIRNGDEECDSEGMSDECDDDCTFPVCGDGLLNTAAGEGCDDAGESVECNANCTPTRCGDEVLNVTAGEECDDGGTTDGDGCAADCTIEPFCGDGSVDDGEECDDGNNDGGDGCSPGCLDEFCGDGITNNLDEECDSEGTMADFCDSDCTLPECGDGTLNFAASEECDDGNTDDGDGCAADCTVEPFCGDGIVNADEECEVPQGFDESFDCDDDCTFPECGDGNLNTEAGEICDDGGFSSTCNDDCTPTACGDSILNTVAGEACDDGNTDDGDGCAADCTIEPFCGDGNVDAGEECDDGNTTDGDGCAADCTDEPFCGDGNVDDGEECDDANSVDGDGCSSDCTIEPFCGDGTVDAGEECDDGNTDAGDGCAADCTIEVAPVCGDGNVDAGEECDDGNTTDGDGCAADCTVEAFCGDGNVDAGEECDDGNTTDGDGCDASCSIEAPIYELAGGACNNTVAGDGRGSALGFGLVMLGLVVGRRRR